MYNCFQINHLKLILKLSFDSISPSLEFPLAQPIQGYPQTRDNMTIIPPPINR